MVIKESNSNYKNWEEVYDKEFDRIWAENSPNSRAINQKITEFVEKHSDDENVRKAYKVYLNGGEEDILDSEVDNDESPLELALMSFETGHWFDSDNFNNADDYEEYQSYHDLGPYGFYEEFKDELDFSQDFINEYGDLDEDDDFDDVDYIDEEIDLGDFYAEGDEWDEINDYYDLADSEAAWHNDYEDEEDYLWNSSDASNNNMFEALRNRKRMQESFSSTTYQVTVGEPSNSNTYTVKANSSEEAVNLVADIMWEEESPYIIDEYEMRDALDNSEDYDNLVEAGSYGGYINLLNVTEIEDDSDNYTLDKINEKYEESIKLSESALYDDVKKEIKPAVEYAIYHFENDLGKEYTEEDIIEEVEKEIFNTEDKYPLAVDLIQNNPMSNNTFANAVISVLDDLNRLPKLNESIESQTKLEKETQPAEEKVDKDMFPTKDSLAQDSANPLQDQTDKFTKEVTGDLEQDKKTVEEIKEKTLDEAYTEADYQEDKKFADFFKQKMIDAGIPNTEILKVEPDIDLGYEKYYVKFEMDISLEDLEKPFERLMKDGYIPVETKEDPEARIIYVTFEFEL